PALLLQIAVGGDAALLQDQHLLAALLDVAQQVGGEDEVDLAGVADVADQLQHALAGRGIEPVGRLVEKEEPGTVNQGLGELGELLHAERVGLDLAVPGFAETDVEERLVGPLERPLGGKARELAHQPADGPRLRPDVVAEDAGGPRGGWVEAEKGMEQRRLAGAVRTQEPDAA